MAKRIRWFISGTGFGIGASIWIRKRIKAKVQEVTPLAVGKAAAESVISLKDRFVEAVEVARVETADQEVALREEMGLEPKRKPQVR
ncbi:MAG: hypothetical protein HKL84_08290 [Acidimicrobiaceae bacterium]|nr:hypothetical protein [Acidimicrobiaceae bacterium]